MERRVLGDDLAVFPVGLGCMGLTHAYGPALPETEAARLLAAAVDMGYDFFDTAECYTGQQADGAMVNNEEILGQALKPYRQRLKIASKFGVRHTDGGLLTDSRPAVIRRAVEGSLKRLQTDYLDLYYQHRIDNNVEPEEVAGVMADLIKEGKILHWGISEADEVYLRRAHAVCPVSCVQNRFSMLARWHEKLFPVLEELKVGFVAFSPLANGFLSSSTLQAGQFAVGDLRNVMPQYQAESWQIHRELLELINSMAADRQATAAQIALAWLLAKKQYIVAIPGSHKVERLRENLAAAELELVAADVARIDELLAGLEKVCVFGGSPIKN